MQVVFVLLLVASVKNVFCKMEGFIVGGALAVISQHPHASFLAISCVLKDERKPRYWICGGSIVNQVTILTAAHCLENCLEQSTILARVGQEHRKQGIPYIAKAFTHHKDYDPIKIPNDIGLIALKDAIKFGPTVQRVVLMKNPPEFEIAQIAGWGRIDEKNSKTNVLKTAKQKLLPHIECLAILQDLPPKTLCAGDIKNKDYVASGDSGSGLLIRGFIQVGIVSYRDPHRSKGLAVYTNTSEFIDWIAVESKKLYCKTTAADVLKNNTETNKGI